MFSVKNLRCAIALLSILKFSQGFIQSNNPSTNHLEKRGRIQENQTLRQQWIEKSLTYYSTVLRDRSLRKKFGLETLIDQNRVASSLEYIEPEQRQIVKRATKHYFAIQKIKNGELKHAEKIYRTAIDEIINEGEKNNDGGCDHASLAVSTLLLALLMQRQGDIKGTRSVFLNFFREVIVNKEFPEECACSAKVLQAYALFEMKRGNPTKSLQLVNVAVSMDKSLAPVLKWKQFRDAASRDNSKVYIIGS